MLYHAGYNDVITSVYYAGTVHIYNYYKDSSTIIVEIKFLRNSLDEMY